MLHFEVLGTSSEIQIWKTPIMEFEETEDSLSSAKVD